MVLAGSVSVKNGVVLLLVETIKTIKSNLKTSKYPKIKMLNKNPMFNEAMTEMSIFPPLAACLNPRNTFMGCLIDFQLAKAKIKLGTALHHHRRYL